MCECEMIWFCLWQVTMETFITILAATQLFYIAAIHGGAAKK